MWGRLRARALSRAFAERLGGPVPPVLAGSLIGLELEYVVRRRSEGRQVDFATLVHGLGLTPRGLDPTDPDAYWLPGGTLLTTDETEAELAESPVATRPGFVDTLVRRAQASRAWLAERLGSEGYVLEGGSTHVSVAAPDRGLDRLCLAYARSWAPAIMLLLDDASSPGLLVRPRPGRIELCGEFAKGDDLRAAALFAVGSTLAAMDGHASASTQPLPQVRLALRMGDQRFGWYVDRRAAGPDLYAEGRSARLVTADGRTRTAQEHLEQAWSLSRSRLACHARPEDLAIVDRLIEGRAPLRVERAPDDGVDPAPTDGGELPGVADATAYGRALAIRRRPGYELAPVMLTWQIAVFVVVSSEHDRRAFAVVPGRVLGRFLGMLEHGRLDDVLGAYLAAPPTGRKLPARPHVDRAGLYDALHIRPALLAPERLLVSPGAFVEPG